jgi:hypothetical protein
MTSLAKRERYAIAQTLRNLGPDAPTLCEGWTSFDLLVHLISRVGIIAKSDQGVFTIKSGNSCVTMEGDVVDLILYSFGRKSAASIKFEGDEESIRILKETKFSL